MRDHGFAHTSSPILCRIYAGLLEDGKRGTLSPRVSNFGLLLRNPLIWLLGRVEPYIDPILYRTFT